MSRHLTSDVELSFVTVDEEKGFKTYERSLCFMLLKAMHDVGGRENIDRVRIHFSIGSGFFCTLNGNINLTQELLNKVDTRMRQLCRDKIKIEKRTIPTDEAIDLFHSHGMYDKGGVAK